MTIAPAKSEAALSAREARIGAFLQNLGWGEARRAPLAGDASFRRYERLHRGKEAAILMDAPPPMEDVRPFVNIARLLFGLGFSVPEILGADVEAGLLLLEDFGDATYTRELAAGADESALYALAVDALIALHRALPASAVATLPPHDDERCQREAALLLDWYWPAHFGKAAPDPVRAAFREAWAEVLPLRRRIPESIALFDFHVDNLMLLRGRPGMRACGLLDFQDAVCAPIAFDLVSLLADVRRDIAPDLVAAMIARYLAANPQLDRGAFLAAYRILGVQRNSRIVGTFARLLKRDGKPRYQAFMPRVWRLIAADLDDPALAPVAEWYRRFLPPEHRRSLIAGAV